MNESKSIAPKTNRLAAEKSPYLKQHQYNPVDWFPWGDEAFNKAKAENKPIFLSIGYSTCHWCHIMEKESFENNEIAKYLNEHFVSIKVDREERPDIDRIYMTFVQATAGQGGWPLSIFLTPEAKPFFGGTYFPPFRKYNRPGFLDILREIARVWVERGVDIVNSAEELNRKFKNWFESPRQNKINILTYEKVLEKAVEMAKSIFDPQYGGFGSEPKFPQPPLLRFLLQQGALRNDHQLYEMVLFSCKAMANGGIHDHLGGGFHRYAVDKHWILPHFEKMLYDNALLLYLYAEAYQISKDIFFYKVAKNIVGYLVRDMRSPEGAFYCAEDADSEGIEGKFYLWTLDEIASVLNQQELQLAARVFNLSNEGNFTDPVHPDEKGLNIIYIAVPPKPEETELLDNIFTKLYERRNSRIRPARDEKILSFWNALLVSALSRAGRIFNQEYWLTHAKEILDFIKNKLWDDQNLTLAHSFCDGELNKTQLQEDYAAVALGAIEYYQATLEEEYLRFAIKLCDSMIQKFEDKNSGGFWQTPPEANELILNLKDTHDGATPSGNSLATVLLLRLYDITGNDAYLKSAENTLSYFIEQLSQNPLAMPEMLSAFSLYSTQRARAVITGRDEEKVNFIKTLYGLYLPTLTISGNSGAGDFAQYPSDTAAVYLCVGNRCLQPLKTTRELLEAIQREFILKPSRA
ncbi:MAG: thioredoxin domain-containing protein [Verrucomicrobiia bacterium]